MITRNDCDRFTILKGASQRELLDLPVSRRYNRQNDLEVLVSKKAMPVLAKDIDRRTGFPVTHLELATPAIASVALYTFIIARNELLYAFLFPVTWRELWTLPLGLARLDSQEVPITALMAGSLIMSVPIIVLFFFFERFLTQGLMAGAVKG